MQLFDPNNPNEKKKMIAAAALGLAAIIVLGYVFLGGSSRKPANRPVATATPTPARVTTTQFINSQQVATTVTADLIANPGNRQIIVKNADGTLYSNTSNLNVTPPPLPNYTYVGLIGKPRFNDTAVLQDKSSKDFFNVQRGDVVGGRFRVTSISDREVVLVDTNLKIRHTIAFSNETSNSQTRPPTRRIDDEP